MLKPYFQLRTKLARMFEGTGMRGARNKLSTGVAVEAVASWLADLENEWADRGNIHKAEVAAEIRGMLNRKDA